jgi:hypothetical protein
LVAVIAAATPADRPSSQQRRWPAAALHSFSHRRAHALVGDDVCGPLE